MKVFSLGLAICAALAVTTASVEAKGTICETGPGFADTGDSYSSDTPAATTATVSSSSGSDATQVAASSSTAGSSVDQTTGSSSTTSGSDAPVSSSTGSDVAGSDATQQTDYSSTTGSDATQVAGSGATQQTDSGLATGSASTPSATSSPASNDGNQVAASDSTAGSDATQVTSSGSNYSDNTPSTSATGSDSTTTSQYNGDSTTQGSDAMSDTTATPAKGSDTKDNTSTGSGVNQNGSDTTPIQGDTPTVSSSNSKGDSSAVDADKSASSSPRDTAVQNGSKPAGSGSRTLQVDVGSIEEEDDATDSDDSNQYDSPQSSDSTSGQASTSGSSEDSPIQQTTISGSSGGSNPVQQTTISTSGSEDSSFSAQSSASASSTSSTSAYSSTPGSNSVASASDSASNSQASSTEASDSAASAAASASSSSSSSSFTKVTRLGVRVQGDMPEWNAKHKRFVSSYYETFDQKYRAVLDTVNMASVEGALKYVQAECINASVITDCERKNSIKYVVFYQTTIVQPTAAMEYYVNATDEHNFAVESCPFMSMDGGRCNPNEDGVFPDVCNQYIGAGGQPDLGFCVGGTLQDNEAIAPYPHNYWFSFPNSCPQELWDDKTDTCREKYAGGMCPVGVEPDGVTCTFTYEILGYILLDDVVGITSMVNPATGNKYADYKEFCEAGGVEFSVSIVSGVLSLLTGLLSTVVDLVEGLEFWANPGDSDANAERVEKLVSAYGALVSSNPATSDGGVMRALPTEDELAALNPSCYENSPLCAESEFGCKRSYLSQICQLCTSDDSGCEKP
ncbi:hypothetical protein L916_12593 [Phytophthora nicotianae]|uniref:FZ domain-containing protein n=1 Tax=Phytophthora nicotianae TaxID=4792 RepID=W2IM81_PHYNI|nr:hypothetical protein L916_12593 [Phytophthora nicotianae]